MKPHYIILHVYSSQLNMVINLMHSVLLMIDKDPERPILQLRLFIPDIFTSCMSARQGVSPSIAILSPSDDVRGESVPHRLSRAAYLLHLPCVVPHLLSSVAKTGEGDAPGGPACSRSLTCGTTPDFRTLFLEALDKCIGCGS